MKVGAASAIVPVKPQAIAEMDEKDRARLDEFRRVMESLESSGETEAERAERIARQEKAARKKREQTRKANQLRGRIAYLRSRMMANRHDKSASGELAMAKTQLYWVMNPLSSDNL